MTDPAEKYRDQVDPDHKLAMDAISLARMLLLPARARFETLLEAEQNMHSVGHIMDPTLYRDMINSKSFEIQLKLVRSALAFLRETDALAAELEGGADQ